MTLYLLRYQPEKLKVLAIETDQPPDNQPKMSKTHSTALQPNQPNEPIPKPPTNPTSNTPGKLKPARAAERMIPRGRPMSDDDEDHARGPTGRGFVKNGIEFADGVVPSHHMAQLTVFWDNQIWKVKGYVPVSMFNRAWLEANREVEGKKSKKKKKENDSDSEDETYEGLTYPAKLRLSYGDWVTCFNLMLEYLRNWFEFHRLATKFERHKKNVEEIKSENDDNWMVALQYDILVRRQIWTIRVEGGKVGDPDERRNDHRDDYRTDSRSSNHVKPQTKGNNNNTKRNQKALCYHGPATRSSQICPDQVPTLAMNSTSRPNPALTTDRFQASARK
ncbi:uncharacterized protein MELLADRAFT_104537 [Melampsora larici-populina 98AG31]|uniref:Uncharacterized protein n=1 Tax=Melampsora larici-populina (strain 98AG31 / pathotype 3-4-7) TaxID=747676 RepID=F4RF08_MELLP|nr:uncharacterized protein MELLADRAFT_104537 [Melampsora larici-populina 98AG31]EGG09023.1 hypothetical protein MELLADRAFT_104537 [Melampsora larici-populina 98AG31]